MARQTDPQRVARKREQIAVTAGRLFAEQGFDRTSVAQVAKAVDISPASVFYYFEDKAALFRAVFENDLPVARELIASHADAADPVEAILNILDALAADAADPAAAGMLVELLRRAGDDPALLSVVGRTVEVTRNGLAALIARGIADGAIDADLDPNEAAAWLHAVVDAAYLNARAGHCPSVELRRTALGYLAPRRSKENEHE